MLVEPADGSVTILAAPHLQWSDLATPTPQAMGAYDIQIASDAAFSSVMDEDRVAAIIRHYVPDRELKRRGRFYVGAPGSVHGPASAGDPV